MLNVLFLLKSNHPSLSYILPVKLDITIKIQSFIADQTASNVEVKSHKRASQKYSQWHRSNIFHHDIFLPNPLIDLAQSDCSALCATNTQRGMCAPHTGLSLLRTGGRKYENNLT